MMATVQASAHGHTNKSVLDSITDTLIANWNTAYTNNHTHSNISGAEICRPNLRWRYQGGPDRRTRPYNPHTTAVGAD